MLRWVLPEYIQDALPAEAAKLEDLRRRLLDDFRLNGYQLVAPPLLEYLESLLTGAGQDLQLKTLSLPEELKVKALTLGANSWQLLLRVLLPQVLPRLIEAVRLTLGSAWLFLIAAEAIAATAGLGYRIFLVRRYLDMAVILPYVLWITLLAFAMDYLLRQLARRAFPWYYGRGGEGAAT